MKFRNFLMYFIFFVLLIFNFTRCDREEEVNESEGNITKRTDGAIRLTNFSPQSSQNPVFSPDDKFILFTRFKNGYNIGPSEIVKINIETKEETIIVSAEDFDNVNVPFGSWIDNKICFSSDRGGGADEIWIVNDDGSNLKMITNHSEENEVYFIEPVFNPKNTNEIVFEYVTGENDATAKHQIAYVNVSSGEITLLTDKSFDDRLPSWRSDGKRILFQRNIYGRDEGWDIYTASINTEGDIALSDFVKISRGNSDDTDCSWCFDNINILSSSNYDNLDCPNIYMFSTDLSTLPVRKTFENKNEDGAPSQSHSGNRIAFESHSGDSETEPSEIWIIDK